MTSDAEARIMIWRDGPISDITPGVMALDSGAALMAQACRGQHRGAQSLQVPRAIRHRNRASTSSQPEFPAHLPVLEATFFLVRLRVGLD